MLVNDTKLMVFNNFENPQFERVATYVMFAHLLRAVATLCHSDRTTMAVWLSKLPKVRTFRPSYII